MGGPAVSQDGSATPSGTGCSGQDESNITLVMIVIVVVFIICELPASANQVSTARLQRLAQDKLQEK